MNYHLIDLSKKYDFNFDNIIIGKKIQVNDNIKYYIYYQQEENTDISNIDEKIILNKENIPRDIPKRNIY